MAIDMQVVNFSGAVLKDLAASNPYRRHRDDPWPRIPAGIQDEIRLKNRLRRQWHVIRDHALKAVVNRLQRSVTGWFNGLSNDQCSTTLESLDAEDQSLLRMTKRSMRVHTPTPPVVTVEDRNSSLRLCESQSPRRKYGESVQPVTDPSILVGFEMVDVALKSYFINPASESK
jgi:hypothetical protein